jgi:hypothetical protein
LRDPELRRHWDIDFKQFTRINDTTLEVAYLLGATLGAQRLQITVYRDAEMGAWVIQERSLSASGKLPRFFTFKEITSGVGEFVSYSENISYQVVLSDSIKI